MNSEHADHLETDDWLLHVIKLGRRVGEIASICANQWVEDYPYPDLTRHPYGVRVSNGWGGLQTLGPYGTAFWSWLIPVDKIWPCMTCTPMSIAGHRF